MKMKQIITFLLLTIVGVAEVKAQTYIVTVGDQVTTAAGVEDNGLYGLYNPRNGKWMYEDSSHKLLLNGGLSFDGLNGSTMTNAVFRLISNGDGTYKVQNYDSDRYLPAPTANGGISTSETPGNYALNIQSDGNMFPRCTNNGTTYGLDHTTNDGVYAFTNVNTTIGGAQNYKLYKIALTELYPIVTLNNTNTSRGALIYNPSASEKWVWSSGKSGTFNSSNANSQWVFYPTGDAGEYYLYNVGAQKFAVPTQDGSYSGYSWKFSHDAVAVTLNKQRDDTYKIFTANGSICMSVSNGYTGPIINYNDVGAQFTMTKLEEIGETLTQEIETAIGKLVHKTTPLAAAPTGEGWYAVRVKTHGTYPDYYLFTPENEINYNGTNYALNFYSAYKLRPAIDNPTYYFRIAQDGSGYDWQMPNGRYLYNNSNKFPVSTETATAINVDYSSSGFRFYHNSRYAVPYYLGSTYFVGETSTSNNTYYDVYPIDLDKAGLVAWQVLCDDAPASAEITCSRTDVSGLTSVYKNGYFFLPTGVTPSGSDFNLPGGTTYTVNETAHTITIAYDPSLAIVAEGVEVHQGYGTTGLGNEKAVLLRLQVTPFNAMENAVMTFTLTNPDNISAVKVYETGNNVEFNAISSYINTFDGTINSGTATVTLGSVSAGTHYYWLCANIANNATVGDVVDAALTGVTYDYNGYTGTTCDLTAVGNPATSMKIFDKQQYLFLPTTNGSNYYRIPALITADDGSLIAACDKRYNSSSDLGNHKIDVVMRRSTDGGANWTEVATIAEGDGSSDAAYGYGDPAFVKCASGKIICLMAAGKNSFWQGMSNIAMVTSTDNGLSWTSPVDITTTAGMLTNKSSKSDWFVTSGKGLCTSDGVIMFLLDADHNSETNLVLYSTDEGATWVIDDQVVATGANEAKLVELKPGKLLSSTRNPGSRIFNTGTYTLSNGTCSFSWGTQTTNSTLNQGGSGNNQDIIVYSRNNDGSAKVLIHTLTTGYGHNTMKLFMSIDQGTTWNEMMQVQPGGSRYAVTTILENGDLGILFEDYSLEIGKEYPINFLTITKEQIAEWVESEVTFHIVDGNGNTLMEKTETIYGNLSELPKDLKRAFCTYTMYSDAALTQQIQKVGANTDVYVKCEFDGPFEFSTTDNPKWYLLHSQEQNSYDPNDYFANADGTTWQTTSQTDEKPLYSNKSYQWAFIGNPYALRLVNRASGKPLSASANSGSNGSNIPLAVTDAESYPYHEFTVYGYAGVLDESEGVVNPFVLILKDSYYGFLIYNGTMKYYSSGVSINDQLALTGWRSSDLMVIEVPQTVEVTISAVATDGSVNYGTLYYSNMNLTVPEGVTAYTAAVSNGSLTLSEVTGAIPAGTGVVLKTDSKLATNTAFTFIQAMEAGTAAADNMLLGTDDTATTTAPEGSTGSYKFYALSLNGSNAENTVGFYYRKGSPDGGAFTNGAHKAYLAVPIEQASGAKGFAFSDSLTGIEMQTFGTSPKGKGIYNLSGQRVSIPSKGIYIVNGKKVVIR